MFEGLFLLLSLFETMKTNHRGDWREFGNTKTLTKGQVGERRERGDLSLVADGLVSSPLVSVLLCFIIINDRCLLFLCGKGMYVVCTVHTNDVVWPGSARPHLAYGVAAATGTALDLTSQHHGNELMFLEDFIFLLDLLY